jgi:hypothetical protein
MQNKSNPNDVNDRAREIFGDAALVTSWDSVTQSGSSVNEYILKFQQEGNMVLKQETALTATLGIVCLTTGFGFSFYSFIGDGLKFTSLISSIIFIIVGIKFFFADIPHFSVNREAINVFSRKSFGRSCLIRTIKREEIKALQILDKLVVGIDANFINYELNIVDTNGERTNCINGPDLIFTREAAKKISTFLSLPVWDFVE